MLPGAVKVHVDLKGTYSVSLGGLNGAIVDKRLGSGPGEFTLKASGEGLRILEVRQGGHAYVRPVSF